MFLALAYDGTVFAASIVGLVYGAILATPFGLMVGGAMASLQRPRAEEEFVGMARRNGVFGLVIAGVAGAAMWPALLFAAIFGILVGWFAAPVLVRLTSQPVAPDREPATFDTALSRSRDSVARSDDEERTP